MGNENSSLIDEHTAPVKLSERSLSAVAGYIKAGHAQKIVVMTGAGLSTAAGSMSPGRMIEKKCCLKVSDFALSI